MKHSRNLFKNIFQFTCIPLAACVLLSGCGIEGRTPNMQSSQQSASQSSRQTSQSQESSPDASSGTSSESESSKTPRLTESGKTQIVLSTFFEARTKDTNGNELPSDTEKLVAEFNAQSDEYEVTFFIGNDEGMDYITYYNRLNSELIAGEGPDLFCATTNTAFPDYVEKNVIEDLKPFIDRDLIEDDYLKNILYAYEKDGKVYALGHSFMLFPYIFDSSFSQGKTVVSYSEIKKTLSNNPQIKSFNGEDAMSVLMECCMFWNWDPSDMEQLRDYILFAEKYGVELDYLQTVIGNNCLTGRLQLSQPDGLKRYEYSLKNNSSKKIDDKKNFTMLSSIGGSDFCRQEGIAFSINASSKVKEGAWEFIKFTLSKEIQEKIQPYKSDFDSSAVYHTGFPIRKEQYENLLKEAATPEEYSDEEKTLKGYNKDVRLNALGTECLTEDEVTLIRNLTDNSQVSIWKSNAAYWEIVSEEVAQYFDHTKSLENCLDVIENRMKLYLAE